MATAVIVAGTVTGDRERDVHIGAARALAAPLSLLRHFHEWELWLIGGAQRGADARQVRFDPDHAATIRFLAPTALLAAKRQERQLPLFDIDVGLLEKAHSMVRDSLHDRVRDAMRDLLPLAGEVARVDAEHIARVSVQAISALAVRDKLLPGRPLGAALAWLTEHHALAPTTEAHVTEVERVAKDIGEGVNFAGLDAAILADLYGNAILEPARRSELGAFYTPPDLGRKMISLLPIEEIEPGQRSVLDPTCGSGSLLLAVNERLQQAMPGIADDRLRHDRARSLLLGADSDPFAVEIARLGLWLSALPYGNGYRIEQRDALLEETTPKARIVVANPPWRFKRADGQREQLANAFLRALLARVEPDGLLACVLPLTWLTDDTSRGSREMLREQTDLFEVWRLPERVFPHAEQAACVIFARATSPTGSRRLAFRQFSPKGADELDSGRSEVVLMLPDSYGSHPLIADPLARVAALSTGVTVGNVATVFNGVPVPDIAKVQRADGDHRLLARYGRVDEMAEVQAGDLVPVQYPDGFWRAEDSNPSRYLVPKILVSATRRVDNPWRLKVFDDPIGVIPRNSMHVVVPLDPEPRARRALLAVLGSGIASAWVDPRAASRNVNHNVIASIPMPARDRWDQLAEAADKAVGAPKADRAAALARMEAVVWDVFGLDDSDRAVLRHVLGGRRAPERAVRIASEPEAHNGIPDDTTANVATVLDVEDYRLLLHVPGVTAPDGEWMPIPLHMPGWALRPGTGLEVRRFGAGLSLAEWAPQRVAHLSVEELLAMARRV